MPRAHRSVDAVKSGSARIVDLHPAAQRAHARARAPEPLRTRRAEPRAEPYDDRGPAWAWDVLEIGEHVGTHFDAPIHWITGRDGEDVAGVRRRGSSARRGHRQVRPRRRGTPTTWSTVDQVHAFEAEHGALPAGAWLLLRTGWDARAHDQDVFLNVGDGQRTRRASTPSARAGWRREPGRGRRRRDGGLDAGAAGGFDPPFLVHHFVLGAGKYGLTQLANLAELPPWAPW